MMASRDLKSKRVGVLMGGLSREREISLRSGRNCLAALERLGYDAVAVDVGRDVAAVLEREGIEVAFLALHGKFGEDGRIQGLLDILGIPYTGSGVLASAIGMNKAFSKKIASFYDIPTPAFSLIDCHGDIASACDPDRLRIRMPVMVKPCEEGSSLGVTKVDESDGIEPVVRGLCEEYGQVIVEEFVAGDEVTVGLLEGEDGFLELPVLQLVPRESEFYDFKAKYSEGMTEFILPARIPAVTADRCQELARAIHRAIGCRGFSRVDFMIDAGGVPWFTEINTLPGMTDTSDLPAQAREAGMSYDELVEVMLGSAVPRQARAPR
ncbi:MAG: D-alanine--D-alanine ligase [Gaiellales bacterium]|nr:MAG: D-alanine--D-alanine ligase [Gaiellales bacterium]